MNSRIAKKIVSGHVVRNGVAKWTRSQYDAAHRILARRRFRSLDIYPAVPARSSEELAVLGGHYLTSNGSPVFLLDTKQMHWMLPVFRISTQEHAVRQSVTHHGGTCDGVSIVMNAASFIKNLPRALEDGKTVVIVTDFKLRGNDIKHTTITLT